MTLLRSVIQNWPTNNGVRAKPRETQRARSSGIYVFPREVNKYTIYSKTGGFSTKHYKTWWVGCLIFCLLWSVKFLYDARFSETFKIAKY